MIFWHYLPQVLGVLYISLVVSSGPYSLPLKLLVHQYKNPCLYQAPSQYP
jgi:hypothetical protein